MVAGEQQQPNVARVPSKSFDFVNIQFGGQHCATLGEHCFSTSIAYIGTLTSR